MSCSRAVMMYTLWHDTISITIMFRKKIVITETSDVSNASFRQVASEFDYVGRVYVGVDYITNG